MPRAAPAPVGSAAQPEQPTTPAETRGSGDRFKPRPLIQSSGPNPDTPVEQVRLAVGLITGPHGIHGELKVRPLTDDPDQFATFKQVYLGDEPQPRKIRGARYHAGNVVLRLAGIATADDVDQYRGAVLKVPGTDVRPLEEGEFFLYQLIGLEARTERGDSIGVVIDLIETGATDVVVIEDKTTKQQLMLPNLPDVILDINPVEGFMVVRPLQHV